MTKTLPTDKINKALSEKENGTSIKKLLNMDYVKNKFKNVLDDKAEAFMANLLIVYNSNTSLHECEPNSIVGSALRSATLDLPIDPNLGFAHLVPYNIKEGNNWIKKAQFQIGWKGFIQLAIRTQLYKTINATEVYEGELTEHNRFTGEMKFDHNGKKSDKIIGYVSYFKLLNGFEKYLYMTIDELEKHAKKYSKSYQKGYGNWKDDPHGMRLKTVVKQLLSKYAPLSTKMKEAIKADQAIIEEKENEDIKYNYEDNKDVSDAEIIKDESKINDTKVGSDQIIELKKLLKKYNKKDEALMEHLEKIYGIISKTDIQLEWFDDICSWIKE